MMQRRHVFLLGFLLLALGLVATITAEPALAAPPHADKPGYSIVTLFTADPSNAEFMASFSPDVPSIYAWVLVVADQGAPEKQFPVDVQFTCPNGAKINSQWYQGDTGKVTSLSKASFDSGSWAAKNVARRQLDIAGTDNASMTGQWSVNFMVGGKSAAVESFTLASSGDVEVSDAEVEATNTLEKQGYTVIKLGTTTWDDGTVVGYVDMSMVSTDLYSAQTSKQIVDGYGVLRRTYPKATMLIDELDFSETYLILEYVKVADWDAYVKSQNYSKLWSAMTYAVWDKEAEDWVAKGDLKDFIKKNFGAGTPKPPTNTDSGKDTGAVGSVKLQVSPSTLAADGSSTANVSVTVFDKKNKALPNTDLTFTVSGTGAGTIRPKATTTDKKGTAVATFTAGSKAGTVTITAAVGKATGTAVVTLGDAEGASDAADNVRTALAAEGLKVLDVQYDAKNSIAWAAVDLGADFKSEDLVSVIVYGSLTLRTYYPDAAKVATIVPFQRTSLIYFVADASDVDKLIAAVNAAKGDKNKVGTALQNFIGIVVNNAVVVDAKTGKVISSFKDFANKNFGGG